jgi:phosphotransferase system HPr (HPr) family protein
VESTRKVRIVNVKGLHARPCHAIVSMTLDYACEFRVSSGDNEVNGRSILELMTLSAPCDTELTLRAVGEDAAELVEKVSALIQAGFDELE